MRWSRRSSSLALLLALAAWAPACAPVHNYVERVGPRYAGEWLGGAAPGSLRIVSFNIRYAREIERAIEVLRESPALRDADVIALQEMDAYGVRRIAQELGLAWVYYPAAIHPRGGKDFGNAVLVRGTILDDAKLVLPHPGRFGGMRRIAVAVDAEVDGQPLRVYSAHLGTPKDLSAAGRRDQVAAILAHARSARSPVVVAGDFNNRGVVGAVFEQAGYRWATRDVGATIALFSWDHVFVRGFATGAAVESGAAPNGGASDHKPVWVELGPPPRVAASSQIDTGKQQIEKLQGSSE
jgi:endonuclease/exonuclease/phosphatase family metal-dependent hydrolase